MNWLPKRTAGSQASVRVDSDLWAAGSVLGQVGHRDDHVNNTRNSKMTIKKTKKSTPNPATPHFGIFDLIFMNLIFLTDIPLT